MVSPDMTFDPDRPRQPARPGGDAASKGASNDSGKTPVDPTRLLHRMAGGDRSAADELLPMVYEELRRIATSQMRGERRDHTLQPTAIVHEAYLRLVQGEPIQWQNRAHFLAVAAGAIRHVLIDHARRGAALKRGGDRQRVAFDENAEANSGRDLDLLDLNDALERLSNVNPRQSRIVELRFFGGLTNEEVAEVMGLSRATISDEWSFARAWLAREIEAA